MVERASALKPATAPKPSPSVPDEDERPGPTREEAVAAFAKDCGHVFELTVDKYDEEVQMEECKARDYFQSCDPDTLGCVDLAEKCDDECATPCEACQAACGQMCDRCKGPCAPGDAACVRTCAEARSGCRDRCLAGVKNCREVTCVEVAKKCAEEGERRKARECGGAGCDAFASCVEDAMSDGDEDFDVGAAMDRCAKKFPKLSEWCREQCSGMM